MKTLQDQLIEKGLSRSRAGEMDRNSTKTRDKREEQLTLRDWAEIMGTNRSTYGRKKGGAFRQR